MIKKIVIRDVASYDAEGVVLDDLQKVNFIYGGNGTGKTTISRVLGAHMTQGIVHMTPINIGRCKIEWKGKKNDVFVYNKDFRDRNFGEYIPGIFTLGEHAIEAERLIEEKQAEQKEMQKKVKEAKQAQDEYKGMIEDLKRQLKEKIRNEIYEKYSEEYGKCLREHHLSRSEAVESIMKSATGGVRWILFAPSKYHTEKDMKEAYAMLYDDQMKLQLKKFYELDEGLEQIANIAEDAIWKEQIAGSSNASVAELIEKLGIGEWVRQGWTKVNDESDVCPFCQHKTITEDLRKELSAYFDDSYHEAAKRIQDLEIRNSTLVQNMMYALDETERAAWSQDMGEKGVVDEGKLRENTQRLRDAMWANTQQIMAKKADPSKPFEMQDIRELAHVLIEQIKEANQAIAAYNRKLESMDKEHENLYSAIWNKMIMLAETDVQAANREINSKKRQLDKWHYEEKDASATYERLEKEIKQIRDGIVSMQPTVDRINRALRDFRFTGFSIQATPEKERHYQIVRSDGTPVRNTLSEGEVTFITFLYFIQMVKGFEADVESVAPRVVVIDDPISSLDSDAIDAVCTLSNELKKLAREGRDGIDQLIVLTHNTAYHKMISERQYRKDTHYWKLSKMNGVSNVEDCTKKNPVRGEYEDLWSKLVEDRKTRNVRGLQNLMRRIVENYFVGFGGYSKKKLFEGGYMDDYEDRLAIESLAKWMDEGSHGVTGDLYESNSEERIEIYFEWFKLLFEKMGHGAHYKMMMREA